MRLGTAAAVRITAAPAPGTRLTLNAAAFFIKWKDIQQQILLTCGFQYRANAGGAESKGGELEVRAKATEHLELSAGLGYQNAKITQASVTTQAIVKHCMRTESTLREPTNPA